MQRIGCTFALWSVALVAAGCNNSKSGGVKRADGMSPAGVVQNFLEAVRTGDDEGAATMLTELAREMAAEHDMVIAPPGSSTAKFTVGESEELPEEIAHVASTWNDDGEEHEIIWALRKSDDGWRIAGMATKVFEDLDAVLLNFEDPEDMFEQQAAVEQEMFRRSQAANVNAGEPAEETVDEMPDEPGEEEEDRHAAAPDLEDETPPAESRSKQR